MLRSGRVQDVTDAAAVLGYRRSVPDPTTLLINCPFCEGPVTVQYEDWDYDAPQEPTSYSCPWCERSYTFSAPGRFLWVTKWHEPEHAKPD